MVERVKDRLVRWWRAEGSLDGGEPRIGLLDGEEPKAR
jgi:hypothetical protein